MFKLVLDATQNILLLFNLPSKTTVQPDDWHDSRPYTACWHASPSHLCAGCRRVAIPVHSHQISSEVAEV